MRFFLSSKPKAAPVETPVRRPPPGPTAAAPPKPTRPVMVGLSQSDLVTLYSVGAVQAVKPEQVLVHGEATSHASYLVVEGGLELRAAMDGVTLPFGVVNRGECLMPDAVADAGALPYTVVAREASTVIEISAFAFELLPPATQATLTRIAAACAARRFNALASQYGLATRRQARLVSLAKSPPRANSVLALPQVRQALAEIPALPLNAAALAMKLLDERTHADEIVESIRHDSALAGLVLKRVNSAYYALETKVSDHYRALLLLGTATVSQLILESAVETVIPDAPESRDLQVRATLTSMLAYEIAMVSGQGNPLVAATIGLLHNVGDSIALVIRRKRPDVAPLLECVEASAVGAAVLAGWGLPERVYQVVQRQDDPRVLLPSELDVHPVDIALLYVARVCHDVLMDRAWAPPAVSDYMAMLNLRATNCVAFCRDVLRPALLRKAECLPAAARARLRGEPIS